MEAGMVQIPIFRLPMKAQKLVISLVYFADIIELTTMSTKFHKLLKAVRLNVDEYKLIRLLGNAIIQLKCSMGNMVFEPDIYLKGNKRLISGFPATIKSSGRRNCQVEFESGAFGNKTMSLEKITNHLFSFLNIQRFIVELDRPENDTLSLKNLFIWKRVQNFYEIRVSPSMHCPKITLSDEELCFFLGGVKFEKLYLDVQSTHHSKYRVTAKGKQVVFMESSWIEFNELTLGTSLESLKIQVDFQFPDRAINRILQEWMGGKHGQLEDFKIVAKRTKPGADVMQDLNAIASIFSIEQVNRRIGRGLSTRTSGDMDIRRPGDNRLATVVTMENSLLVFFWHEKHFKEVGIV